MSSVEKRLKELNLELPPAPKSVANYLPFRKTGNLIYTAGALPMRGGKLLAAGRVPSEVTMDEAVLCARFCALNNLAVLKEALDGDWNRLVKLVSVTGFVASDADFEEVPQVINGASDLFVEVLGDAGKHARVAVGAAVLPMRSPVEVQVVAEIK